MEDAAELLSPPEADWPLQLRLPATRPPPPSGPTMGMDDSQFLGSIMGEPAQSQHDPPLVQQGAPVVVRKKRGRPPKNKDAAAAVVPATNPVPKSARRKEDEEEVVCFICFDGGDLVVCDRRGCPKVYHPACIKRDAAFFQSRSKWNCGWHICSSCEKAVCYMCYSCTYSVCKACIKQGKFFSVRGTKGFCDTCFGTILLIESKDEGGTKVKVDFDDRNSWEYLFKLYWLDLKGKLSLTMEEVTVAKNRWNVPSTSARKEKDDSSGDLYDANNDDNAGSDCSSRKRKRANFSRKRGRKCRKENSDCSIAAEKIENATGDAGSLPMKVPSEGTVLPLDTKWASPELLEFVGHMRDGDQSFISQFDVQALLLDYIKKNDLRDPRRKSQIICDSRLHRLFKKTRVAHFEMLKLLEMQFLVNEASTANDGSQGANDSISAQIDGSLFSDVTEKVCPGRKKKMHRKMERESLVNLKDYAAIDMHNVNLIYLRRSLMEDLIDDSTFSDKIAGGFVRIKISGLGHKQDMYRLVKVIGTHKVPEKYSTGKKSTNLALEILNLNKKEIITIDTVSNQDFTEEECTRLRQSMKYGLISPLKVGDIQEKAMIFQSVRVNDWLENEKQRLGHLRDRASETGRRKELRECVEKLQLLNTSEEQTRRINEVLEVHVDSCMDPDYESVEEMDDKIAAERNVNGTRFDGVFSKIKKRNHAQKISDTSNHPKNLSKQSTVPKLGAGKNLHSTVGTDIPKSGTNINSTIREAASLSSSGVTLSNDMEPEKVWHYKDPSGNVQGPFTLMQLSKWTIYFPRDLRVWLTFESEDRSLLLTEVLSKQPKDFSQAASVASNKTMLTGSGQNRKSPNVDLNIALSPVGYSVVNSSEITVQSTKYSVPERGSVNSFDDRLSLSTSSVPPKDADTTNSQVQYQTKHSGLLPSPGSPYEQSDTRHDGVQERCSGEWNKHHSRAGLCSPEMPQTSCSGQSNVESHHNQHASWSQVQHDSKISLQASSVKDLGSRQDYLQTVPSQLRGDVASPVLDSSPSESRTASSQHESPCLSSTTNTGLHDELHSSISSEKAKSCTPATLVEDRGSSSPSGMLSQLERAPICSPQSIPSASTSEICKMEEVKYQQRTLEADASNASVNQFPRSKIFPDYSTDNQDIERGYPSPTPRSENKEPAADHSGSTSVAPETCDNKKPNHPPVASVSPKSGPPTEEIGATGAVPNLEKTCLIDEDSNIQKELYSECTLVKNEKLVVDPVSYTEPIDVSNVLESVSNIERRDLNGKDSNIQKEVYTSEKMAVDPASCAELIDMSDVLESVPNLKKRVIKGGDSNIEKKLCNESTLVTSEKMVVDPASCTEPVDASDVLESVSNLEKRDLKGEDSNIKKELFSESILITNEKVVVDPASCAESIDVPDVLKSVSDLDKTDLKVEDSVIKKELQGEYIFVSRENIEVNPISCADSIDVSDVLESVSNLEKKDLKSENSVIQKELQDKSIFVTRENMGVDPASCAESIDVSDILESVSNLEKTDLKGGDSNIQKELHEESTLFTIENMMIDPSPFAEPVDVSGVLVSSIEQRRGTLCMDAIAAIEEFMNTSTDEEPQCSSPIALSPWGEPGYYQGDSVESVLWGVQDDPISDMWSFPSPTPALEHLSGVESAGEGIAHVIDAVTVTLGDNKIVQRGATPGEEKVELANPGASTAWGLAEQVKSKAAAVSASSVDRSTGILDWQPSANESSNMETTWSTVQDPNLSSYERAVPSVKTSLGSSGKQERTELDAANFGEALGNTKSWNPSTGNANRGSQRSQHHRDRYSQINESWLLSSNYSRNRSDGFGSGGTSRRGQTQSGICKFYESGYCRKGSSCNYLHPSSLQ